MAGMLRTSEDEDDDEEEEEDDDDEGEEAASGTKQQFIYHELTTLEIGWYTKLVHQSSSGTSHQPPCSVRWLLNRIGNLFFFTDYCFFLGLHFAPSLIFRLPELHLRCFARPEPGQAAVGGGDGAVGQLAAAQGHQVAQER